MGLIYNPSPTATLKALYGQAFRAPNPFERFYNTEQANQPELKPEKIKTYELVYEQYFGHRYRLGASLYHYDVEQLITQTQTELGDQYFANLDKSPHHLAKAQFTAPLHAQVLASLELQYNGSSRTIRAARSDDFLVANFTLLSQKLLRGLEVSLSVYNLLDERHAYPGSGDNVQDVIEQNGRSVQGKVTYRF
jgi:iron complex outermembrane receptor protein